MWGGSPVGALDGVMCGPILEPRADGVKVIRESMSFKRILDGEGLIVLGCTLLGCISPRDGHRREAFCGVFTAVGILARRDCVIAVFGGATGDEIKVSMFIA